MNVNVDQLAEFLVEAKKRTYAGDGENVPPQRPGFKELELTIGDWNYRDSYAGFFVFQGQEVVCYQGIPVWAMAYSGGMLPEYQHNNDLATQTFAFLKRALLRIEAERPFRGPQRFRDEDKEYYNFNQEDIAQFTGREEIIFGKKKVYQLDYVGGIILPNSQ